MAQEFDAIAKRDEFHPESFRSPGGRILLARPGSKRVRADGGERQDRRLRMPLFEYECQDCGRIFEVFTRRRELWATPKCPECGKANVERVLSSFSGTTSGGGGCVTSGSGFG
jgi:putative FmdB family regulatory protein